MEKQPKNGFAALVKSQNVKVEDESETKTQEIKPEAKTESKRQPSREGTKAYTVHLNKNAHAQFKMMAIEKDTSMHDLMMDAFNMYFELNNKPPIA